MKRFIQLILLVAGAAAIQWAGAATVLSGNVSGTWTTNGSPYILSADCTVASNQTLTILPGVTVTILSDVNLKVSGGIMAVGTAQQPVVIAGFSTTNYWGRIEINNSAIARFERCKISEGTDGLYLYVDTDRIMAPEIRNCVFQNCYYQGIYGRAQAPPIGTATLAPEIHNNVFDKCATGCEFVNNTSGRGYMNPVIAGNIFKNARPSGVGVAGALRVWTLTATTNRSYPVFVNNVVSRFENGVFIITSNFFPIIENNVFINCDSALFNNGGMTPPEAKFNCFFQNGNDFVYYPGSYGLPVIANHNGTACDVYYNIFVDPRFLDTNSFLLSNASPCIDAGDPAMADVCFQFSHGSAISDIGAYGGPDACGWLTNGFAPIVTASPSDQSSCVGGSAKFKVSAVGSAPLDYRWYFNRTNLLASDTNAQLNLANLQTNQAGLYAAAVSNAFGSVTSAPARLLVFDACVGLNLYAGLSITGMVGRTYAIETATNLSATNWTLVATNTFTTPRWLFIDTNTPFVPGNFFRVRLLP